MTEPGLLILNALFDPLRCCQWPGAKAPSQATVESAAWLTAMNAMRREYQNGIQAEMKQK
jgi:hypothetical protein